MARLRSRRRWAVAALIAVPAAVVAWGVWRLPSSGNDPNPPTCFNALGSTVGCDVSAASVVPYAIGALRDATGSTAAGMYVLAVTLVLGAACVFAVPGRLVNK